MLAFMDATPDTYGPLMTDNSLIATPDHQVLCWLEARRRALLIELGAVEDLLITGGKLVERTRPPRRSR